jgi:hypothetical protein
MTKSKIDPKEELMKEQMEKNSYALVKLVLKSYTISEKEQVESGLSKEISDLKIKTAKDRDELFAYRVDKWKKEEKAEKQRQKQKKGKKK